jgi:lipoprotein-anchoring transpeptidase ErfK/SrfK
MRGRIVRRGKVAVGARGMETPLGLFYVTAKFDPTWPVLGAYAFETSAYSKLSEWPGGGVVGLHGTNAPHLLGQAVSHGCIRISNADAQYLRSVVPLGTPVKVVA